MNNKLKLPLLLTSIAVTVVSGWQMYSRFQVDELWGHRPLFLYLGLVATVLLLLEERFERKMQGGRKLLLISLLTGVLLAGGFTPMPFFPLMFVGFVPLLIVEKRIAEQRGCSRSAMFKYAFWGLLLWNVLSTYWVTNTLFMAGVLAMIPGTLLMTIPWILFHHTKSVLGDRLGYASLPAYWMTFELTHLHWKDMSWPWLNLGNSFARFPEIIQWYDITGSFGGSLWIWVLNLLIFFWFWNFIQYKNEGIWRFFHPLNPPPKGETVSTKTELLRPALQGVDSLVRLPIIFLIFLVPIIFSLIKYFTYKEEGKEIEVVVVNPNYEPHYEKFEISQPKQLKRFFEISREGLTPETDYLVFPETSFGNVWHDRIEDSRAIKALRGFLRDYPNTKLVTGLSSYRQFKKDEPLPKAPRFHISRDKRDTTVYESYNSAVQIAANDTVIQDYFKAKLVPGAEYPPFARLTIFRPIVNALGGSMSGLGTQPEREAFFNEDKTVGIGPVICYESVFGEYVTGYVRAGANALFIVTNDGWWDNTAGHVQHNHFASIRAIETRRSIARSANLGTCGFINQRGDRSVGNPYDEMGFRRGKITLNNKVTFYVRYGDLIARIALFLSAILLLLSFVRGRLKKLEAKH